MGNRYVKTVVTSLIGFTHVNGGEPVVAEVDAAFGLARRTAMDAYVYGLCAWPKRK
jgi:hypothetical protein